MLQLPRRRVARRARSPRPERRVLSRRPGFVSPWKRPFDPPPLSIYTPKERRLIQELRTPEQVERWLCAMPYNWERRGETARTLRGVVRHGQAHCLEAALSSAAILEQHGHPPILMDLESIDLLDHVLLVVRDARGRFGTVARSRDPGLHGRRAVYPNIHTLVRSYAATYIDLTGCLKGYGILDLRTLRVDWRTSTRNVWAVIEALIENRHRKFTVSKRYYDHWHRRYEAYKRRHPDSKPVFYPNRRNWLGPW